MSQPPILAPHTAFLHRALALPRQTRIMDVGANPANVPDYAGLRDAGLAEIHGFEPGQAAYDRLIKDKRENETYHPYAIGKDGPGTFHATMGGSMASLFKPSGRQIEALGHWKPSLTVREEIELETKALDSIPDLPRPDMLKMDTQGAELDILEGGQATLLDAVAIVPEIRFFQLYEGEPMLGPVDVKLREMGFMLHKILPGARLRLISSRIAKLRPAMTRNQMIDADAIYIRDIAYPERMSDAQIGRLALLADAVFNSMDLALRCLDLLVARGAFDDDHIDTYISKLPPRMRVAV
ncbi:MAG: FkbM family methyltransferase [Pseudomonadota bacterium]